MSATAAMCSRSAGSLRAATRPRRSCSFATGHFRQPHSTPRPPRSSDRHLTADHAPPSSPDRHNLARNGTPLPRPRRHRIPTPEQDRLAPVSPAISAAKGTLTQSVRRRERHRQQLNLSDSRWHARGQGFESPKLHSEVFTFHSDQVHVWAWRRPAGHKRVPSCCQRESAQNAVGIARLTCRPIGEQRPFPQVKPKREDLTHFPRSEA
jgi:hypothetical protein